MWGPIDEVEEYLDDDFEMTDEVDQMTTPTVGSQVNNFYGDITLVLGGDQTDIMATMVQPSVAKHIIDAIKEVAM